MRPLSRAQQVMDPSAFNRDSTDAQAYTSQFCADCQTLLRSASFCRWFYTMIERFRLDGLVGEDGLLSEYEQGRRDGINQLISITVGCGGEDGSDFLAERARRQAIKLSKRFNNGKGNEE